MWFLAAGRPHPDGAVITGGAYDFSRCIERLGHYAVAVGFEARQLTSLEIEDGCAAPVSLPLEDIENQPSSVAAMVETLYRFH